uniref:Purine nucleoside phosphorylase n=1 Tax=Caligus rogercresseyi TaxID=217165 RepID=C1BNW1_CALRO|nr:Purine nucleoside phosphorylase [Caligus rogercresseyi]
MERNGEISTNPSLVMSYKFVKESADFILEQIPFKPTYGIICGSGLGTIGEAVNDPFIIEYSDIPHFPTTSVGSHRSRMIFGKLGGASVMVMQGRFHYYEGHSIHMCSMPIRVMHLVGVKTLISTNASGALNDEYSVGDLILMNDHINLLGFHGGQNPLRGSNHDDYFGTRFVAMNRCYDAKYLRMAREVSVSLGMKSIVKTGIYAMTGGPSHETPAELRSLKILGADCIGMSTVHENIVARQCGMRVFSLSLITNKCALNQESEEAAGHAEVIEVGKLWEKDLQTFMIGLLTEMNGASL